MQDIKPVVVNADIMGVYYTTSEEEGAALYYSLDIFVFCVVVLYCLIGRKAPPELHALILLIDV